MKIEEVVIQVTATGSPEITWYNNGEIIADDKHYELDHEDNGSTLIIHDIKMTHAGVYEFTATNRLGVKGQMRVFVKQEEGAAVDEVVPSKESLNSESVLQLVYLSQLAGNNCNGGFKRQFQVSIITVNMYIYTHVIVYMYIRTCMHILCMYLYIHTVTKNLQLLI